jgi:hypothetical protein
MTTQTALRTFLAALLLAATPTLAGATPGQSVAQFQAWAKANPALHSLSKKTDEMSGAPYFSATFHAGSTAGNFMASIDDGGNVASESVAVDGTPGNYDILKHLDLANQLLQTVYGGNVGGDFAQAKVVGRWTEFGENGPTVLYRGSLYGYEAAHSFVKLIQLAAIAAEAKQLQLCSKQECGD